MTTPRRENLAGEYRLVVAFVCHAKDKPKMVDVVVKI
jgi:hypothetical protein